MAKKQFRKSVEVGSLGMPSSLRWQPASLET